MLEQALAGGLPSTDKHQCFLSRHIQLRGQTVEVRGQNTNGGRHQRQPEITASDRLLCKVRDLLAHVAANSLTRGLGEEYPNTAEQTRQFRRHSGLAGAVHAHGDRPDETLPRRQGVFEPCAGSPGSSRAGTRRKNSGLVEP